MKASHQSSGVRVLGRQPGGVPVMATQRLQARRAGWLVVQQGRAWITRDGDPDDHVLAEGDGVWVPAGTGLVVEPWQPGRLARLDWQLPLGADQRGARRRAGVAERAWLGLAGALRTAAGRLLAAARSAEAMASRAQGSIKAGDSMASCGAAQ